MPRLSLRSLCLTVGLLMTACGDGPLTLTVPPLRLATGHETRLTLQVERAGVTGDLSLRVSGLPAAVLVRPGKVMDSKDTAQILFRVVDPVPAGTQATAHLEVFNAAGQRAVTDVPVEFDVPGGAVDAAFGWGGGTSLPMPDNLGACGAAAAPGGHVVLARAYSDRYEVSWFDAEGAVLRTTAVPEGRSNATAGEARCGLAVTPEGGVWLSGTFSTDALQPGLLVTRLLPDGSRDPAFGADGVLRIDTAPWVGPLIQGVGDLFVLPDGRALVSGSGQRQALLLRLRPDGTPDPTFGQEGRVLISAEESTPRLFPAPSGRFLAAVRQSRPRPDDPTATVGGLVVQRFLSDGRRDPSYGAAGLNPGLEREAGTVAAGVLKPDGALVLSLRGRGELLRLTRSGSLDTGWGVKGYRKVPPLPGMMVAPPLDVLVLLEDGRVASAAWGVVGRQRGAFVFTLQSDGTVTPTSQESLANAAVSSRPASPGVVDPRPFLERARGLVLLDADRGLLVSDLLADRRDKDGRWPVVTDLHLARFFL